jgi:hypothetical protein
LPRGGFGNLIALPLQKKPRETGNSVFVDRNLQPYADQWSYLAGVQRLTADQVESVVRRIGKGGNVLDIAFISDEDEQEPAWIRAGNHEAGRCLTRTSWDFSVLLETACRKAWTTIPDAHIGHIKEDSLVPQHPGQTPVPNSGRKQICSVFFINYQNVKAPMLVLFSAPML